MRIEMVNSMDKENPIEGCEGWMKKTVQRATR